LKRERDTGLGKERIRGSGVKEEEYESRYIKRENPRHRDIRGLEKGKLWFRRRRRILSWFTCD